MLSEANGVMACDGEMRMPPRAVTADRLRSLQIDRDLFVAIARELGDAAESPEAPLRVGIFEVLAR